MPLCTEAVDQNLSPSTLIFLRSILILNAHLLTLFLAVIPSSLLIRLYFLHLVSALTSRPFHLPGFNNNIKQNTLSISIETSVRNKCWCTV
jgi:hypothetical protein